MVKHFCDECGKELTPKEVRYCMEMIGKDLCAKHAAEVIEAQNKIKYVKQYEPE